MAERRARLASRSDPSWIERRITSGVIRRFTSDARLARRRRRAECRRRRADLPHRVEYFHQVDDPYSHLAAQLLPRLAAAYDVELVPHLVGPPDDANAPERALLSAYARKDAADVASFYGVAFPRDATAPTPESARGVARALAAAAGTGEFAARAASLGEALWSGRKDRLDERLAALPAASDAETEARIARGDARRRELGHYSGATFHHAGEWYWGADRLHHLEERLTALGARREGAADVAPRPARDPGPVRDDGRITLEFFASLRSPYTAIAWQPTVDLARRSGVRLVLRPVLPMVMRGVPATLAKGRYIFSDAKREARTLGVPFGRVLDPIGRPVERAYALFPWARRQGRGAALLGSFLQGAFAEGIDTSRDAGLREVVERAGLSWNDARTLVDTDEWRAEIDANQRALYEELGLWGVPSYRVRGPEGVPDFATWGQDRLWRVAHEIRRRIAAAVEAGAPAAAAAGEEPAS